MDSEDAYMHLHKYPVWAASLFDNKIRAFIHKADVLFGAYVKEGDTVVDIGIGGGIFTIGLARLVGENGLVIAVDFQQGLITKVQERARKESLSQRIRFHRCERDDIGLDIEADFVLSFWMVHEVPNTEKFLRQVFRVLKPSGKYFLAEPKGHVKKSQFEHELSLAKEVGFVVCGHPKVALSRAVVLEKAVKD